MTKGQTKTIGVSQSFKLSTDVPAIGFSDNSISSGAHISERAERFHECIFTSCPSGLSNDPPGIALNPGRISSPQLTQVCIDIRQGWGLSGTLFIHFRRKIRFYSITFMLYAESHHSITYQYQAKRDDKRSNPYLCRYGWT